MYQWMRRNPLCRLLKINVQKFFFVLSFNAGTISKCNIPLLRTLFRLLPIKLRPLSNTKEDIFSVKFVGTLPFEGLGQLKILVLEGCTSEDRVLEVGCGALMAGYPIIQYLNPGNYVGIEPNQWLIERTLTFPEIKESIKNNDVRFLNNEQFDATSLGETFDFVISHSVLCHCAHWQLPLFLENLSKVLPSAGKILASIRFCDGNEYGSPPYGGTENDFETWQYPGVSYFRKATVTLLAEKYNFHLRFADEYTKTMVKARRHSVQDWIVLIKK